MIQLITKVPTSSFVTMTQQVVDKLLELNTKNRNLRHTVVEHYRRAIENDMWILTNQGIGVSASGILIDGQHRLEAMREAGYPPITMLVVTGLPDAAVAAVDAGANRTARDYMQFMFDTKISALVSAILRTSLCMRDGDMKQKYYPQEFAERLEILGESINRILTIENMQKMPAASLAAMVDAHNKGYQSEVESFAKALGTGEMLERDNPALLLRNWIAANKGGGGTGVMTTRYKKTMRALQAWIEQRPLGKLYKAKSPIKADKRLVAKETASL